MYAGVRARQNETAVSKHCGFSLKTEMFIKASAITSSQLPLKHGGPPVCNVGTYCVASMVAKLETPVADHPALLYRVSSAASAQTDPVQPDWTGALLRL